MAVKLTVRADVVDLRSDTPIALDEFFVDTNVLIWLTYTRSTQSPRVNSYQTTEYPTYIKRVRQQKGKLFHSASALGEMASFIEGCELDIYNAAHPSPTPMRHKAFRHTMPTERRAVVTEIETAWNQVTQFSSALSMTVDEATSKQALRHIQANELDVWDAYLLEVMGGQKLTKVISDDGDWAHVPGLTLFTASLTVIREARDQNKLRRR